MCEHMCVCDALLSLTPTLPEQEADIWSCGVILYILLCGWPPFHGESTQLIFKAVMSQSLDMRSDPWPRISDAAKDCVRRMLTRDPNKRLTAEQLLRHPWMKVNGAASDTAMTPEFLMRLRQFGGMNHLKKEALKVRCAVCLCSCACPESLPGSSGPTVVVRLLRTSSRSAVRLLHATGSVSRSRLACATTALLPTLSASWPLFPPAVRLHPWTSQSQLCTCSGSAPPTVICFPFHPPAPGNFCNLRPLSHLPFLPFIVGGCLVQEGGRESR